MLGIGECNSEALSQMFMQMSVAVGLSTISLVANSQKEPISYNLGIVSVANGSRGKLSDKG